MPIVSFELFPSINRDSAGDKRVIHDMLNFQPLKDQSGIAPVLGNSATHEITTHSTKVGVFLVDPTLFGLTEGYMLVAVDMSDVGSSGNGRILSHHYREDPHDRARNLFTGSIQFDDLIMILPVILNYSAVGGTYTRRVKLASVNITDDTSTYPLGTYDETNAFVDSSEPFTPYLPVRIYRSTQNDLVIVTPVSIDIVDISAGTIDKSITIANQAAGPVNSSIGIDRNNIGYFATPAGVLYRFRISGASLTATSLGSVAADFNAVSAGIRPFTWLCHSMTGNMYVLCEGYNSASNRISLVKFKKDGLASIAKDFDVDFSAEIDDFIYQLDSPPHMFELPNGNLLISLYWDTVGTDELRFIEIDYENGTVLNDCTILDTSDYGRNWGRGIILPDGGSLLEIHDYMDIHCFDVSDVSSVSELWSQSYTYYESVFTDKSITLISLACSKSGRVWLVFGDTGGYGSLMVWNAVEIDPDDGTVIGDSTEIGESVADGDAWSVMLNDDFDGYNIMKTFGYV